MKFELLPVVTYAWRRRGQPARVPTPGKNRKLAVIGAMRWPDRLFRFRAAPRSLHSGLFIDLLPQLYALARRRRRRVVLVLDNGPQFTSRRSRAAVAVYGRALKVVPLPRYSSEQLNDIEGVWKHLDEDYFSRMLVPRPDDFEAAALRLLQSFRRPGALRRAMSPPGRRRRP